jgi:hypothetical protein
MKRIGWLVLALGLAGGGCMALNTMPDDPRNRAKLEEAPPPPPPVRADDVNAQNAWDTAQALGDELRSEEQAAGPLRLKGVEAPAPATGPSPGKGQGKRPGPPASPGADEVEPAE